MKKATRLIPVTVYLRPEDWEQLMDASDIPAGYRLNRSGTLRRFVARSLAHSCFLMAMEELGDQSREEKLERWASPLGLDVADLPTRPSPRLQDLPYDTPEAV